jgi:hypothetical protein
VVVTTTEHNLMRGVDRLPRRSCPCISVAHIPEQPRLFYDMQVTTSRNECDVRRFFLADLDFDNKGVFVVLDTAKSSACSRVSHIWLRVWLRRIQLSLVRTESFGVLGHSFLLYSIPPHFLVHFCEHDFPASNTRAHGTTI